MNSKSTTVVESWEGSKGKQSYTHSMTRNASVTFTWAFQKTNQALDVSEHTHRTLPLKIYYVKMTANNLDRCCMFIIPCFHTCFKPWEHRISLKGTKTKKHINKEVGQHDET